MKVEFKEWPKTPRLFREIVVTEKLDGTNAAVQILELATLDHIVKADGTVELYDPQPIAVVDGFAVYAQSRNRLIFPGKTTDNYGFAGWVENNAASLVEDLGEGIHYGEWWGQGVARKYNAKVKTFSLFNVARYADVTFTTPNLGIVPVLYEGENNTAAIEAALTLLGAGGSVASPGFMNPEGVIVFHSASRQVFKVTLDSNDQGKWQAAA
ncbi:hypothetical protein J2X12_002843 [Pseudarthrobacter oxydans]|uniref:RNA ligase domain-containing protein n=1 Tax=Pseudarthrobacter oxydans TaxID=1671 RepID=A0AAW8ND49_PSEOX|nr:RNA ligase family protein [Pseudarthrobacter oxydans]MDR6794832.1 hypothetical protein [Pseudarthrobacter oxydans]MDR7164805.1 hypothetical protein [Pseudarthrobacter oxydans]